jgi:hypothetical protein
LFDEALQSEVTREVFPLVCQNSADRNMKRNPRPAFQQMPTGWAVLSSLIQVPESKAGSIDAAWRRIPLALFPAPRNEFPVPGRREFVANSSVGFRNIDAGAAGRAKFSTISLYFPCRSGIRPQETSSPPTHRIATESVGAETCPDIQVDAEKFR